MSIQNAKQIIPLPIFHCRTQSIRKLWKTRTPATHRCLSSLGTACPTRWCPTRVGARQQIFSSNSATRSNGMITRWRMLFVPRKSPISATGCSRSMRARCNSSDPTQRTVSEFIGWERQLSPVPAATAFDYQRSQLGDHVEREIRAPGVAAVRGKAHFGEANLINIVA